MRPVTEFRTLPATAPEPDDRTVRGTAVGSDGSIDLGSVDTTDEARDTPVRVFWWRVRDMNGVGGVRHRIWLEGADGFPGANAMEDGCDDVWTREKPRSGGDRIAGTARFGRNGFPAVRMTGADHHRDGHTDTSRYIYLTGRIGVNEPAGTKTGLRIRVRFRYL